MKNRGVGKFQCADGPECGGPSGTPAHTVRADVGIRPYDKGRRGHRPLRRHGVRLAARSRCLENTAPRNGVWGTPCILCGGTHGCRPTHGKDTAAWGHAALRIPTPVCAPARNDRVAASQGSCPTNGSDNEQEVLATTRASVTSYGERALRADRVVRPCGGGGGIQNIFTKMESTLDILHGGWYNDGK